VSGIQHGTCDICGNKAVIKVVGRRAAAQVELRVELGAWGRKESGGGQRVSK